MDGMLSLVSYGVGTILGMVLIGGLVVLVIHDVTRNKHTALRNFPVVGRLRFFFENLGEYFRQYFFAGDRAELPFNRAMRGFVYRLAKNEGSVIGFGSTNDLREPSDRIARGLDKGDRGRERRSLTRNERRSGHPRAGLQ